MPTIEFKGKQFVHSHHLSVPFRELVVDADRCQPKVATGALFWWSVRTMRTL